jgi:hypothetical protein
VILFLKRQGFGVTPAERDLAPGSYHISLSFAGHCPVIKGIELSASQSLTIEEVLGPRNEESVRKRRDKAGGESGMKEPHSESLANYADLESCAGGGDIAGEALTEALMGRL